MKKWLFQETTRKALEDWLDKRLKSSWPEGFFEFLPVDDVPDFKGLRNDLKEISEDSLA